MSRSRRRVARTRRALVVMLCAGLLTAPPAAASPTPSPSQDPVAGSTVVISPPSWEADASPGGRVRHTIAVTNGSDAPRVITSGVSDREPQGERGQSQECTQECPYPLASWITVTPAKATVPARGRMEFAITIDVPLTASPGAHFGSVEFAPEAVEEPGIRSVYAVSSLVLLRVAGQIDERASISSFAATGRPTQDDPDPAEEKVAGSGTAGFAVRVRNEGNVQVTAAGTVTITPPFGRAKTVLAVPSQRVLPGSVRRLDVERPGTLLPGRYLAEAAVTYGDGVQRVSATTYYWVVPWWLVLLGAVMVIILLVGLVLLVRLLLRRRRPA